MKQTTLRKVKKGNYFRFKNDENAPLYVRDSYDRYLNRYVYYRYDDVNNWHLAKGDRKVFIENE